MLRLRINPANVPSYTECVRLRIPLVMCFELVPFMLAAGPRTAALSLRTKTRRLLLDCFCIFLRRSVNHFLLFSMSFMRGFTACLFLFGGVPSIFARKQRYFTLRSGLILPADLSNVLFVCPIVGLFAGVRAETVLSDGSGCEIRLSTPTAVFGNIITICSHSVTL